MTTIQGVDYSGRPTGAALKAAGVKFAARYFNPGHSKTVTADEARDLHTNGIVIVPLCETTAGFIMTGHKAVQLEVKACADYADSIGVSLRALYCACDQDITEADFTAVDDGLFGASLAIGRERVGIYGEASLIQHCQTAGTAAWFMQAYAWSGGVVVPGIHLYQTKNQTTIGGVQVDIDEAYCPDYGQWPAPVFTSDPSAEEDDEPMFIVHCTDPNAKPKPREDYGILSGGTIRHLNSMDTVNALAAHMPKIQIDRSDWNSLVVSK